MRTLHTHIIITFFPFILLSFSSTQGTHLIQEIKAYILRPYHCSNKIHNPFLSLSKYYTFVSLIFQCLFSNFLLMHAFKNHNHIILCMLIAYQSFIFYITIFKVCENYTCVYGSLSILCSWFLVNIVLSVMVLGS
jgi:hypothetical protein